MNLSLATVLDNADPSGPGRIKIVLSAGPGGSETWAPIISPFAGDARGLFLTPEIGDEVLVGYLDGGALSRSPWVALDRKKPAPHAKSTRARPSLSRRP